MTITNRAFAFLVAGVLVASPLFALANEGENRKGYLDEKEHKFIPFSDKTRIFGGDGDRGKGVPGFVDPIRKLGADGNVESRIEMRIDNLESLIDRIEDSERLSSDQKASLIAGIEAQIELLQDLQVRVENGESKAEIKADLKLALKGKVHAMPKGAVEAAAERVLRIVDRLETLADRLEARIDDARDDGDDVSVSVEAHEDLVAHLADARAEANAAIDLVADLDLDTEDDDVIAENRRILVAARDNIEDAYQALKAAREEVRIILVDLDIEAKAVIE